MQTREVHALSARAAAQDENHEKTEEGDEKEGRQQKGIGSWGHENEGVWGKQRKGSAAVELRKILLQKARRMREG